jgi:hypothetical protein
LRQWRERRRVTQLELALEAGISVRHLSFVETGSIDPALFCKGGPGFLTEDEESSGIIDASEVLGRGWFLFDAQVHKASPDPAAVEPGQLLAMRVPKFGDVYTIDD